MYKIDRDLKAIGQDRDSLYKLVKIADNYSKEVHNSCFFIINYVPRKGWIAYKYSKTEIVGELHEVTSYITLSMVKEYFINTYLAVDKFFFYCDPLNRNLDYPITIK